MCRRRSIHPLDRRGCGVVEAERDQVSRKHDAAGDGQISNHPDGINWLGQHRIQYPATDQRAQAPQDPAAVVRRRRCQELRQAAAAWAAWNSWKVFKIFFRIRFLTMHFHSNAAHGSKIYPSMFINISQESKCHASPFQYSTLFA